MRKILIIVLLILFCPPVFAASTANEDSLKAAFIFHFINFTEWNDDQSTYFVCIPDDEALRETARQSFTGKTVNNRSISVVNRREGCHILVSDNAPEEDNTLTIGHLNKGALFEFRLIDNKMKFAVNLDGVKNSKLKISSQLLKLAIMGNIVP